MRLRRSIFPNSRDQDVQPSRPRRDQDIPKNVLRPPWDWYIQDRDYILAIAVAIMAIKPVKTSFSCMQFNQSISNFYTSLSSCYTAMTTKSVTVTQLSNSYKITLGKECWKRQCFSWWLHRTSFRTSLKVHFSSASQHILPFSRFDGSSPFQSVLCQSFLHWPSS